MSPVDPGPDQRRRDLRLAWILIGCGAGLTLLLLVAGLIALRAPLARWSASLATPRTTASATDAEARKETPDADDRAQNLSGDNVADLPEAAGEVRKRRSGEADADEGDEGSVRRGTGDRPRPAAEPARGGPIA